MNKQKNKFLFLMLGCIFLAATCSKDASIVLREEPVLLDYSYQIVDTGQDECYDDQHARTDPKTGDPFYGQDAQYQGNQPSYRDNGDGTISDLQTGLMWQKSPDLNKKSTFAEAEAGANDFELAGYKDWRLPTIKELYSLIDFRGSSFLEIPYIDTKYFDFRFGGDLPGERLIDAQYWSSTEYVGTTMGGDATVFGVNFADGRIKGYPRDRGPGGQPNQQFVRYVRGNPDYGKNQFVDNGDGTITDQSTGLQWLKADSPEPMDWEAALAYAENMDFAGYDDWRLPNAKELQSIVDYTLAPDAQNVSRQSAAIDPIFSISHIESWHWTSTTHLEGPRADAAVYICFGQSNGKMHGQWLNVHGAGAQRSDPKSGDPTAFPDGRGPQGDEIRILNYVRCVR